MKKILLIILILTSTPGAAFEQAEKKNPGDLTTAALTTLESDWTNAFVQKDAKLLNRFMADDFLLLGQSSSGALIDKSTLIQSSMTRLDLLSFSFDDVRVQIHGETAIFHCKYTFRGMYARQPDDRQPYEGVVLITDTWVRQGDQWRVLARHSSKLPSDK